MATTKVGGGVVDLNEQNTDTVFQMPVGSSSFTGTPVTGMIRNNSSLANNNATTVFEYYDGTQWVGMVTDLLPLADFLVLAGGGSGGYIGTGYGSQGGGGAGGLRTSYGTTSGGGGAAESQILLSPSTTYTITIGGGGNGTTSTTSNGQDSSIMGGSTSISSFGGGGGGGGGGLDGGSGGGSGAFNNYTAQGTNVANGDATNQGFNGSPGFNHPSFQQYPGSGGGAGGAGIGSTGGPGPGGDCLAVAITGSSENYGAGGNQGGGSCGVNTVLAGTCGIGGSSGGPGRVAGGNAVVNTGSGGGGAQAPCCCSGTATAGGNGSSGVVILRMATSLYSGTTTGSPTVTTDGTDTILKFTGSGTYTH